MVFLKRTVVALALTLTLGACGGDEPGDESDVDFGLGGDLSDSVPACPFTADKVSGFVGKPMVDQGNCSFGDGKGVGLVTITVSSQVAGATTYDYQRETAGGSYAKVTDLDKGDRAYIAVDDIKAEAVLVSEGGSYTLILDSLSLDPDGYERALRAMLDEL